MQITVAICTRNPRKDYLRRVLRALSLQSLPKHAWELIIVDSASTQPLAIAKGDLPAVTTRQIRLELSGLLRARFAAIRAAVAPLILFLDDDNVPAVDFLQTGLSLSEAWPQLGCWGPGNIVPDCEAPAPPSISEHFGRMACCCLSTDRWSNTLDVVPPGAGLFVRRLNAMAYAHFAELDPRRQLVGETADRFFRGDDTDLVFHVVKSGCGAGQFRALNLVHLMPSRRLTEDYVVSLARVAAGSAMVINYLWGSPPRRESFLDWVVYRLKAGRFTGIDRRIAQAHRVGEAEARRLITRQPK